MVLYTQFPKYSTEAMDEMHSVALEVLHQTHLHNDVTDAQKLQVTVRMKLKNTEQPDNSMMWARNTTFLRDNPDR